MNENITLDDLISQYELRIEAYEAIDLPLYEDEIDWASLSGLEDLVIED